MQRDGATLSIWQTEPDHSPKNSWSPEEVYDTLIVGAGITGLTTAILLQERGQRVLVAEAHNVGYGTSGGTTAHLNTYLDADYAVVEKDFGKEGAKLLHDGAAEAIQTLASLASRYGIECGFEMKPGYVLALDDKQAEELADTKEASERVGMRIEWTDTVPVNIPFQKAVRFEGQAQYHASKYLLGLAKAFEQGGGVILHSCPVKQVARDNDVFSAESALGELKARALVWATHIPPGINVLHFRNAPYRSYAIGAILKNEAAYPDALVYDNDDPYHYYRTQEIDGQRFLIAGGYDHKTGHEENTDAIFHELEGYVRKYFPVEHVPFKWSSQYYEPADGLPYIGLLPGGRGGEYCATGFSGNGQVLGTLSAVVISDLITKGASPYEDLFKPSRIKPIAGFMDFVKENADVVKHFVADRFSYEKIEELADIAPGEGRLVEYEGDKLAVYKNEQGLVHAVSPVCTHAKCIVAWNSSEKSWDCPCHGARYAPTGEVLTGPARQGLEVVMWKRQEGD